MHFRIEQLFDGPLDRVEAAFVDPGFIAEHATLPKVRVADLLEQRREGGVVRQRVRYVFEGDLAPVVRRVIDPDRLSWVEESEFDAARHRTELRIVPDHYGDRLRCAMVAEFEDVDGATARRVAGDIKVPMPLVGRRVEAAIVSGLEEHARDEIGLLQRWLAG